MLDFSILSPPNENLEHVMAIGKNKFLSLGKISLHYSNRGSFQQRGNSSRTVKHYNVQAGNS